MACGCRPRRSHYWVAHPQYGGAGFHRQHDLLPGHASACQCSIAHCGLVGYRAHPCETPPASHPNSSAACALFPVKLMASMKLDAIRIILRGLSIGHPPHTVNGSGRRTNARASPTLDRFPACRSYPASGYLTSRLSTSANDGVPVNRHPFTMTVGVEAMLIALAALESASTWSATLESSRH